MFRALSVGKVHSFSDYPIERSVSFSPRFSLYIFNLRLSFLNNKYSASEFYTFSKMSHLRNQQQLSRIQFPNSPHRQFRPETQSAPMQSSQYDKFLVLSPNPQTNHMDIPMEEQQPPEVASIGPTDFCHLVKEPAHIPLPPLNDSTAPSLFLVLSLPHTRLSVAKRS